MERVPFSKNIIVLGYGTIAKTVLPLIIKEVEIDPSQILVLSRDITNATIAENLGIQTKQVRLTKENYQSVLSTYCSTGDMIVNLTAEVSSTDLITYCSANEVLYLDTCIELWPDEIDVDSKTYDERETLLDLKKTLATNGPTALSSMGANPGIVSLLTKEAVWRIASKHGVSNSAPQTAAEWAALSYEIGLRVIHVNERDTQTTNTTFDSNVFVSTWSVEAMIVESIESAEMALGSHEEELPKRAHHAGTKNKRDIYFETSGKDTVIKTWLPKTGEQTAMILNHNEPYSIAELYTHIDQAGVEHSPTTCFAYHPSEHTVQSLTKLTEDNFQDWKGHLLGEDIVSGYDELGVLLLTETYGGYWFGSQLDIQTARNIAPNSTATSLQVAGGVIAGMCWIMENQTAGLIEPENIPDYTTVLNRAEQYWGDFVFKETNWRPKNDSLQFSDFLV